MTLLSTLIGRQADLDAVRRIALGGASVSLIGISNLGKTAFLRQLCNEQSSHGPFVYVDCNQMGERTLRAFLTTTWHALANLLEARKPEWGARAHALYDEMIHAPSAESVALHFAQGFEFAFELIAHPIVFCFDEFDEVYRHLEPQTFLNLRALNDRYAGALAYIAATERELARLTESREQGEFLELLAPHSYYLHPMESDDTRKFCAAFAAREGVTFSAADFAFVRDNADGHPGLALAVCYALGAATGAPVRGTPSDRVIQQLVQQNLASDGNVQSECAKIWDDLDDAEREVLLHFSRNPSVGNGGAQKSLRAKFLVRDGADGTEIFSRLFAEYVRRQQFTQQPNERGVAVDADAGTVWVDGTTIGDLTDLEYRLLLFLYGRLDRVCDKYTIVQSVWGEEYVDKVDDARIEKLVSRVRAKIETDPARPRYLVSVRGRGYKLVR